MKIGIIVAMDKEFELIKSLFKDNDDVCVVKSGIGKVNAALVAQELAFKYPKPDIIVSTGCAGGASDLLNVGDVVVSESVRYHDVYCGDDNEYGQIQGMPAEFLSDEVLIEIATSCNSELDFSIFRGTIASGDYFVTGAEKTKEIISKVPNAIAIDMESAAIAQVCYINNIKFVAFRVISDVPIKVENNSKQYNDFWSSMAENSFKIVKTFIEKIK